MTRLSAGPLDGHICRAATSTPGDIPAGTVASIFWTVLAMTLLSAIAGTAFLVASRTSRWAELGEISEELAMALAPVSQVDANREHEDSCHQCTPIVAEATTRFRKLS